MENEDRKSDRTQEDYWTNVHDEKTNSIEVRNIPVEVVNPEMKEGETFENTDFIKLKSVILSKITSLGNSYFFIQGYSNVIINIFQRFNDILYHKITNTLSHTQNFFQFFKEVSATYNKFSGDLAKTSAIIKSDIPANEQMLSDNLSRLIEKTQENIAKNFLDFSSTLNIGIVVKGPFNRMKEVNNRLYNAYNDICKKISVIASERYDMQKLFDSKYGPLFEKFKKNLNNPITEQNILESNEFLLVEMDLARLFEKFYGTNVEFLNEAKSVMSKMRSMVLEYVLLIKESIDIYIQENKKIFSTTLNLKFEGIQNLYDAVSKESLELDCSLGKVLSSPEMLKWFNEQLAQYQNLLVKYNIVKDELIYCDDKFKVESNKRMDEYIDLLISLSPKPGIIEYTSLRKFELRIKRDPGIFQSWRNCALIISKQNNVLIFDESVSYEKFICCLNLKKLQFKKINDACKNPYRFVISEIKQGLFFNSTVSCLLDAETKEKFADVMTWIGNNVYVTTEGDNESKNKEVAEKDVNNNR